MMDQYIQVHLLDTITSTIKEYTVMVFTDKFPLSLYIYIYTHIYWTLMALIILFGMYIVYVIY